MRYSLTAIFMIGLLCCLCTGCSKPPEPPPSLTEAQQRLEDKCREEFNLYILSRQVGKTLYIYLPTDKPIFDYEAQKEKGQPLETTKKKTSFNINFLETHFKERNFLIEYDITDQKKTSQRDYGYSSSYSESYIKQQNDLFVALSTIYVDTKPADNETPIDFIVIIIRDIKKGIEASSTIYFNDFKRYMAGDLPWEEFMKRFLPDTKGSQKFIGDETGKHVEYIDIQLSDFLAKQMLNRIQFRFQRSDFTPDIKFEDELLSEVANTLNYYKFDAFDYVKLDNLRDNKKYMFDKSNLAVFAQDQTTSNNQDGKLIHIIFENGKIKSIDNAPVNETGNVEKAVN